MPTDTETVIDYAVFLADLEAKRAALDNAINSLRAFLSMGGLGRAGEGVPAALGSHHPGEIHGGEIPAGAFLGKSIPESARLYLSIVKSKKTTREISDALRKGGMETTSDNFENIVHAGLNRAMKNTGGFLRVGRSWALPEWYPAAMRGVPEKREKPKKRKALRKPKSKGVPEKVETVMSPAPPAQKLSDRVVAMLRKDPKAEFTSKQLSDTFSVNHKVMAMMMGTLVKKGRVVTSAPDTYRTT